MTEPGLSNVSLPELQQLLRLTLSGQLGTPLRKAALQAHGLGPLWDRISWLATLDSAGLDAVLHAVIAERTTRPVPRLELVWTGPEAKVSAARDTAVVVRELFGRAQRSVLVAGFRFTGREILEPLHVAMRDRNVDARLFLHIDDLAGMSADASAQLGIERFVLDNWPLGAPLPALYYDPRTVAPGSSINLHAKCVIVDERFTLVGSANYTHNAQARSIEVGLLVEDTLLAMDLTRQWQGLVEQHLVRRMQWPREPCSPATRPADG